MAVLKELADSILRTLTDICKKIYGRDLVSLVVYGSVARNSQTFGSDIDLLPVIRTPDEVNLGGYFYLDMVDDAVVLYDKNNFFADYLDNYKERLKKYGAKKRPWKGGYYWEIKPGLKPGEVIEL